MVFDLSLCLLSNLRGKNALPYPFFFNPFHLPRAWQVPVGGPSSPSPLPRHLQGLNSGCGFLHTVLFAGRMNRPPCNMTSVLTVERVFFKKMYLVFLQNNRELFHRTFGKSRCYLAMGEET